MSRLFRGYLGGTLGLLLVRVGCLQLPGEDLFWALASTLGLLCAGLGWQLYGVWNMIYYLCGWKEKVK